MCFYALRFTPGGSNVNNIRRLRLERSQGGSDYNLLAGQNPLEVAQTTGYQEFKFPPTCSFYLRITVTMTWGGDTASIAELRWGTLLFCLISHLKDCGSLALPLGSVSLERQLKQLVLVL